MASVELVTGKRNTVFETHAGNEATHIKRNKAEQLQVQSLGPWI